MGTDEQRFRTAERAYWEAEGVEPAETWLELPTSGASVRAQVAGDGPTVVFLHGGSSSGANWAPLIGRLDGFRCVAVDRPGCGLSPPLAAPFADIDALATYADGFVADLVAALGLERAPVVATSFGGYLALRGAAAHPHRFERIVEFAHPVGAPTRRLPLPMRMASIPAVGRLMTGVPPTRRVVRSILRSLGMRRALADGTVTEPSIEWFLSLLRDTDTLRNELAVNPPFITLRRGIDDRILLTDEVLGRITCPVHFLWGRDDPMGGADVAHAFVRRIPDGHLEMLPDTGHAPWFESPDRAAGGVAAALS